LTAVRNFYDAYLMLQRGLWVRNWLISIKLSTPHSLTTYRITADMARSLIPWLLILLLVAGFQDSDPGADVWQCLLQTGNQLFLLYRKNPHALLATLRVSDPDPDLVPDPHFVVILSSWIRICFHQADPDLDAQITLRF
jgi:hypothetical protein